MAIPEGWTDDMTISVPSGRTLDEILDVALEVDSTEESYGSAKSRLVGMGLSEEDADLAIDRARGGVVRAETKNMANEPSETKDPIAWLSFHRTLAAAQGADHRATRPGSEAGSRRWWEFWK